MYKPKISSERENIAYTTIQENSIGNNNKVISDSTARKHCIPIPNNPVKKNNNKL